jgi:tyrosyl-tRNA synthetase
LHDGVNPRDIKLELAFEVTKMYHNEKLAHQAQDNWISTFSKKEIPDEIPLFRMKQYDLVSVLIDSSLTPSKSEAKRAIEQGGVKINGEVIKDIKAQVKSGDVIQKGKIHFIKVE